MVTGMHSGAVPITVEWHPSAPPAAVDEILRVAPRLTVEVSEGEAELVAALSMRGFRPVEGPWFDRLWRRLDNVEEPVPVAGFTARPVRDGEVEARVEIHRRAWDPKRIKRMLGLTVTGDEGGSGYHAGKHRAVMAAPHYRPDLDLVAVDRSGDFAAYALGWFDPVSRSVLFEPVGTAPEYGGRGLARALRTEILHTAERLGATRAVVNPGGAMMLLRGSATAYRSTGSAGSEWGWRWTTGWARSRAAPSTSTLGRMRSSQRGIHQAERPSRCMTAGISSMRTRKASTSTPNARPKPSDRIIAVLEKMKPPNTEIMMIAAAVTTVRPARTPCWTATRAEAPWAYASRMPETRNS